MQYRHGDVGLERIEALPRDAKQERRDGDVILAYGEVTGHAHRIASPTVSVWSVGEQRYIHVEAPADLTHEEHGTITLPAGDYRVIRQREYEPERERYVAD